MTFGISFIIPTFNEELYIGRCLETITNQMAISSFPTELIVVDNESSDKTVAIACLYTKTILYNTSKRCPAITRNIGARQAKYSILCFIDGDCLISDGWIARIADSFSNEKIGALGGPILSPQAGNWIETTWAPPVQTKKEVVYNAVLSGANFSIRKDLFNLLGGFDEQLISAEDDVLSKNVIGNGFLIRFDGSHSVIHLGYPKSLSEIFKKQIWHGSTQMQAHGILGDKVVFLTIMYLVLFLYFLGSIITFNYLSAIFSVILIFIAPMFLVYGRFKKNNFKGVLLYLKMYVICVAFLNGRTVGLIKEINKILIKTKRNT